MSAIDELSSRKTWSDFLSQIKKNDDRKAIRKIESFVKEKKYLDTVKGIQNGSYQFSAPKRIEIPKPGTDKKRVIYTFKRDDCTEHLILRVFAKSLMKYDKHLAPNLYSFRSKRGVREAMSYLKGIEGLQHMYAYKADISQYFNSIDTDILFKKLKKEIDEDEFYLIEQILMNPLVEQNGVITRDTEKGIMPGLPFATYLSNFFLNDMDWYFHKKGIVYCRFADDIIVFSKTKEELKKHVAYIRGYMKRNNLVINRDKEYFYSPEDCIEFLGMKIHNGDFDLSDKSLNRMLSKIRIEGRHYRKTVERKEKTVDDALHCMVTVLNRKLYGYEKNSKACWSYWYFPLVNTDRSLKIIDQYEQMYLRYVVTGRHNKGNVNKVPYRVLKKAGYVTLTNRYYARDSYISEP